MQAENDRTGTTVDERTALLLSPNFARVHETLRVTPAMEHGIARRIMAWNDLLNWQEERKAA